MTRLFTPACSSPPSVAMCPLVAARSPTSSAAVRRRRRARASLTLVRVLHSRPSPRAFRFGTLAGANGGHGSLRSIRFARLELELITQSSHLVAHRHLLLRR